MPVAIPLHSLPARRVTVDAAEGRAGRLRLGVDEAENRRHAQHPDVDADMAVELLPRERLVAAPHQRGAGSRLRGGLRGGGLVARVSAVRSASASSPRDHHPVSKATATSPATATTRPPGAPAGAAGAD